MPYPPEVKAHARHVYEQAGAEAAAQATGVHVRTIREWAQHENWPRTISAAAVAATVKSQAMRVGWHTRRPQHGRPHRRDRRRTAREDPR